MWLQSMQAEKIMTLQFFMCVKNFTFSLLHELESVVQLLTATVVETRIKI